MPRGYRKVGSSVGSGSSTQWKFMRFLPVLTAVFAVLVIFTCNVLARGNGHVPSWMVYPPISFTGYAFPERGVYMAGFSIVAGAFVSLSMPFCRYLLRYAQPQQHRRIKRMRFNGLIAFAGLGLHAIIPLQIDILEVIQNITRLNNAESGNEIEAPQLQLQSGIHQLAAAVFFLCSFAHGIDMLAVLKASPELPVGYLRNKFGFLWKVACLGSAGLPLWVSLLYHPASGIKKPMQQMAEQMEVAGLSQWTVVGGLIGFYASYSSDFHILHLQQNHHVKHRDEFSDDIDVNDREDVREQEWDEVEMVFSDESVE
jgi:hypothetical protein